VPEIKDTLRVAADTAIQKALIGWKPALQNTVANFVFDHVNRLIVIVYSA